MAFLPVLSCENIRYLEILEDIRNILTDVDPIVLALNSYFCHFIMDIVILWAI